MTDHLQRLVAELSERGFRSPYLDRLKARAARAERRGGLAAVQQEILGEMAAALGRAEDRVNAALLRLQVLEAELDRLVARGATLEQQREAARAFNEQRSEAEHKLWELSIHREALGLRRHDVLKEHYPLPPPRRP